MTPPAPRGLHTLETNPALVWLIFFACGIVMIATVVEVPYLGASGILVDFDAFYIVGQMIRDGNLPLAYDTEVMRATQQAIAGKDVFMPWTYPPQFDLVVALLPYAPRGLSYAVFISLTFLWYFTVLRRLAGPYLCAVLIAILPALIVTIQCGQNGLLTGGLIGWFCLTILRGRTLAGVPLGLMVIKPHLAIGLGILVLATRRWNVLLVGLAVVAALSALATLAFGTEVWTAFLASVPEAKTNLERGLYPIFRMTSAYAALFTLGLASGAAMIAQVCVAAVACGGIVVALVRGMPLRQVVGLSCLATLAVSPYNYDYDMPILGVALAVLAPDLIGLARPAEKLALLGMAWLSGGWGLVIVEMRRAFDITGPVQGHISLAAFGHLMLLALTWHILLRAQRTERHGLAIS